MLRGWRMERRGEFKKKGRRRRRRKRRRRRRKRKRRKRRRKRRNREKKKGKGKNEERIRIYARVKVIDLLKKLIAAQIHPKWRRQGSLPPTAYHRFHRFYKGAVRKSKQQKFHGQSAVSFFFSRKK